jgi:hypothetical protein
MEGRDVSTLLETMQEEQQKLSLEVEENETVQKKWEERVTHCKAALDRLKESFNRTKMEEILGEEEVDLINKKGQAVKSVIVKKIEEFESHSRNNDKLKISEKFFRDEGTVLADSTEKYKESVEAAEKETEMGKELQSVRMTKEWLEVNRKRFVEQRGSGVQVQEDTRRLSHSQSIKMEKLSQLEEECEMLQQVISERRGIVTKMEIEARVQENKLQAQVRMLRTKRDSLQAQLHAPGSRSIGEDFNNVETCIND